MYRVFGYDNMCRDFDFTVDSFVEAVKFERENRMCVVFCTCEGRSVRLW